MKLIACEMVEDEIRLAMRRTAAEIPAVFLERGLHSSPERLRQALQAEIDRAGREETVLLGFSHCGGAAVGLRCTCARLVLPRFADCVRILLSEKPGMYDAADVRSLYSSRGWMESSHSIRRDYDAAAERMGEARAKRVFGKMLRHYRSFCMMDTGAYALAPLENEARETADLFGLTYRVCPGYLRVYEKLLTGAWDEEFIRKEYGGSISDGDFLKFSENAE